MAPWAPRGFFPHLVFHAGLGEGTSAPSVDLPNTQNCSFWREHFQFLHFKKAPGFLQHWNCSQPQAPPLHVLIYGPKAYFELLQCPYPITGDGCVPQTFHSPSTLFWIWNWRYTLLLLLKNIDLFSYRKDKGAVLRGRHPYSSTQVITVSRMCLLIGRRWAWSTETQKTHNRQFPVQANHFDQPSRVIGHWYERPWMAYLLHSNPMHPRDAPKLVARRHRRLWTGVLKSHKLWLL